MRGLKAMFAVNETPNIGKPNELISCSICNISPAGSTIQGSRNSSKKLVLVLNTKEYSVRSQTF